MHYSYSYSSGGEEMLGVILFYVIYLLMTCGFAIGMYVLRSIGIYAVAKRRGLKHAWFAWLPVVDHYLLGCISDQYRYVVKGQNKNKRKLLLVLDLILVVLAVVATVSLVGTVADTVTGFAAESALPARLLGTMGLLLPMLVIGVVMTVIRYMALYDLYVSCDPGNSTMYLVLSILFQVTEPFFVFFNRKKDGGMPPRREPEPQPEENWVYE